MPLFAVGSAAAPLTRGCFASLSRSLRGGRLGSFSPWGNSPWILHLPLVLGPWALAAFTLGIRPLFFTGALVRLVPPRRSGRGIRVIGRHYMYGRTLGVYCDVEQVWHLDPIGCHPAAAGWCFSSGRVRVVHVEVHSPSRVGNAPSAFFSDFRSVEVDGERHGQSISVRVF